MSDNSHLVTADELERMPEDDYRYELVEGRLVRMSPVGYRHGQLAIQVGALLLQHVKAVGLGVVLAEVGFKLATDPDTVRGPDVAFVRRDRMLPPDTSGFYKGAPDLAVEILSPENRPGEIGKKVDEYLTCGTSAVVVVDPDRKAIVLHRRLAPPLTLGIDDTLDLDDVVPGFRCQVRDILA